MVAPAVCRTTIRHIPESVNRDSECIFCSFVMQWCKSGRPWQIMLEVSHIPFFCSPQKEPIILSNCLYSSIIPSGNRTPGSRFYSDLLDTSVCIRTQASFKALGCSYNCKRLTYGSFQLTHMSRDDTLFNWSSHGGQNEDRTILQRSQRFHKGEFRHVSMSTRQRSLRCGQNLRGPFLRATLPDRALERWRTTGRQKGS